MRPAGPASPPSTRARLWRRCPRRRPHAGLRSRATGTSGTGEWECCERGVRAEGGV
ncbi:hypothetical protein F751_5148 [Auxenochlorella protothecoides]|uniref:Uncharacterized protein n=1 Tax=Auxenochlorella protothecoides TaxID=3075 RepID=A0A087SF02_AUXPR|nr:hypothetical protein F751_5148 [Auxenochlorella protothecoides]KFM24306.1 hypothetical protein F751_5148 [Auxenochlorella protothecoides]